MAREKKSDVTVIMMNTKSKAWKAKMADLQKKLDKKYDGFHEQASNCGYRVRHFNYDIVE